MMFIGREYELQALNQQYQQAGCSFVVMYGRRRVGKTTLIKEFCKDKNYHYMMGLESSAEENLKTLSMTILKQGMSEITFATFEQAFAYFTEQLIDQKTILVIDEFPYLANSYPTISSLLQRFLDHEWKQKNLLLILCGSSMSFMEKQVLGYQSPLYGRRTMQMKVLPFNYLETSKMFPTFSLEEQAIIYSFTGGIPEYLSRIREHQTIKEIILSLFLNKGGRLYEEPSNLMKQELRDPSRYNAIVETIAKGASRLSDISSKTKMETSACSNYIDNLIGLEIIEKQRPANESTSKKTIYRICDPMFRFWYTFVLPNLSLLEMGFEEDVYEQKVEPQLSSYMGYVFEDICIQYLQQEMKQHHIGLYPHMGKWWGTNPKKKQAEEIDIMFCDQNQLLLGECKWWNQLVDQDVLFALLEKGTLFPQDKEYYVFAKCGFTKQCIEEAKKHHVELRTLEDIYQISKEI